TPEHAQALFAASGGLDPLFRPNDTANSPAADVSTEDARRAAYSLLLTRGLVRVGIGIPATAEFTLEAIDDPYGRASAAQLSLYRRPLPTTNMRFLSAVNWDQRANLNDLAGQARTVTLNLLQASSPPTAEQLRQIVDLETSLHTAQDADAGAGSLEATGGQGGPAALAAQDFHL